MIRHSVEQGRGLAESVLLRRFAPASVLLDADHRILHQHGDVGRYIDVAGGTLDPGAARDGAIGKLLRALLREVAVKDVPVQDVLGATRGGTGPDVEVTVEPVEAEGGPLILVSFVDRESDRPHGDMPGAEGQRAQILTGELDHRVKNILAVILSIVRGARTDGQSAETVVEAIEGRIQAMARVYGLLGENRWNGVGIRALLGATTALTNGQADPRVVFDGPDLVLTPKAARALAMVLHELTMNAFEHGALRSPKGQVVLSWRRLDGDGGDLLVLDWRETEGLPVAAQEGPEGFGMFVIKRVLKYELDAEVSHDIGAHGAHFEARMPAERVTVAKGTAAEAARPTPAFAHLLDLAGLRVLVVEDATLLAAAIEQALLVRGCEVIGPVSTVAHALQQLEGTSLDAAVLDVGLDDDSVFGVADRLTRERVPFCFVSGYDQSYAVPDRHAGAPYLPKPVDMDRLAAVLAGLAGR